MTGLAIAAAICFTVASVLLLRLHTLRTVVPLRAVFGLAERLLYATSIAWLLIAAVDLA